jgi:DNA-binding protein YbaB
MHNQMKQVMEMQKKAKELQKQLEAVKIEKTNSSRSLGLMVNGAQKVESIRIDPGWFTLERKSALETSLVQLINEAFQDAQRQTAAQAASLMKDLQGLNLPGF